MPKSKSLQTPQLDEQIGFKLRLAQLAVFGDIIEALKALDLRPVDLSALLLIEAHPGVRQHVIGDKLKIARPNIVALVDSLSKRGLVERVVDAKDRRANQLQLTPAGVDILISAKAGQETHKSRLHLALKGVDIDNFLLGLTQLSRLGD
ncbi:MarR family winged helix-turn-helix transcriptional regulator [Asticcacaulis benevestitus]|uniref:MarR family winged helix-turn-helix transcriptional regulator n=1 Tax=Asticcacaulis benevestitus TaxID=347481 RepID=UPI0003A6EC37|nr:MarR family transcriptional regulator [Asticcacaulis benevestitus]